MKGEERRKPHHRLVVWQRALALVRKIYELTAAFPAEEKYALAAQMRGAAVSIPSNIAEGAARSSRKEFIHFLFIAQGSVAELETQVLIARDLGFLSSEQSTPVIEELDELSKMIIGLQRSLK
jgi:four helix bundle protein